ncbi:MAG: DNA-methyltransferase [Microbacterium sp.]
MPSPDVFDDGTVRLLHGDARDVAATLPSASVQAIVTSPPYFGLRQYEQPGQYGAEASLGDYIDHLTGLFDELWRVLADDGTLWLNLGDSYASQPGAARGADSELAGRKHGAAQIRTGGTRRKKAGVDGSRKNLLGVPWRVAFALQDAGWILRSDIIWRKSNALPESVTDRPTRAHEYVFLFAKSDRYYFDADAIAEPSRKRPGEVVNRRTVWDIPTVPSVGSHEAVFPPDLPRLAIRAGTRPGDTVLDPAFMRKSDVSRDIDLVLRGPRASVSKGRRQAATVSRGADAPLPIPMRRPAMFWCA